MQRYRYALGEQYLTVDDLTFCFQDLGDGEPVIILPGLGTSIDFWQLNVAALAEHYRVLAIDLPGFGKSAKPANASYELDWYLDRLRAFLDARHVERAHFVGGSMGGQLALLMALRHPERVEKVVAMGASGNWELPGPLAAAALHVLWNEHLVADYLRSAWPQIFWRIFSRRTPLLERLLAYQMAVRADAARYWPQGRASTQALRSIILNPLREELAELRRPVLLIWGAHDEIHPADGAVRFRERLPDARLVVIPDAAHEVMMDRPEVFNELVLRFLANGTAAVVDHWPDGVGARD